MLIFAIKYICVYICVYIYIYKHEMEGTGNKNI